MTTEIPHVPLVVDQSDVRYLPGPDSAPSADVPAGTTTELTWDDSAAYPGTSRRVTVHVPAGHDAARAASLLVCLDGRDLADALHLPVVLDRLVHRGDLPPTVAVLVDPGVRADGTGQGRGGQRNLEYDAPDDRYATFLLDEVLPEVGRRWAITDDASRRAIAGFSSGGSAAFTAAWHRPDAFGLVLGLSASFAQVTGGNPYPALVGDTARKPLRVLLQVGHRDLGWDEPPGSNWLAENLRVAAALAEATYDVRLVLGDGGHEPSHAAALLPDALRWLFRPRFRPAGA